MKRKITLVIITTIMGLLTMGCTGKHKNENVSKHKIGKLEVILLSEGQHEGSKDILLEATPKCFRNMCRKGPFLWR